MTQSVQLQLHEMCEHLYRTMKLWHREFLEAGTQNKFDILNICLFISHLMPVVLFQLEQKQVVPPFKPNISGEFGLDNFDAQFTNEPIQLTPDDESVPILLALFRLITIHLTCHFH